MEENPQQKFEDLVTDIIEKKYDLICFQEINQAIESPVVPVNDLYHPTPSAEPIHQDHYVRCLVEKLGRRRIKLSLDLGLQPYRL